MIAPTPRCISGVNTPTLWPTKYVGPGMQVSIAASVWVSSVRPLQSLYTPTAVLRVPSPLVRWLNRRTGAGGGAAVTGCGTGAGAEGACWTTGTGVGTGVGPGVGAGVGAGVA